MACTNCRRRKVKCNIDPAGTTRPCERCRRHALECVFEPVRPPSTSAPTQEDDGSIRLFYPYSSMAPGNTSATHYVGPAYNPSSCTPGPGVQSPYPYPPSTRYPNTPSPMNNASGAPSAYPVPVPGHPAGYGQVGGPSYTPVSTSRGVGGGHHMHNPGQYTGSTSYSNTGATANWITLPFVALNTHPTRF
ncbi:hypothetical protein PM082_011425 [Marasmius tenuissimus]|nr:hypothetical protein PM082_011425 [Marasmius tenuissimus]